MTDWLIIRTDFRKEAYVARQITALCYDAWVPYQWVEKRVCKSRAVTSPRYGEPDKLPILPRRLFAAVPHWAVLQGELSHIRHLTAVECGADSRPLSVPDAEISRFRAAIDAENAAAMALSQQSSKRQKAKWRSLKDALLELVDSAKQQMEQAA